MKIELTELVQNPTIEEKYKESYKRVLDNLWDEETNPTAKRKITLDIIFSQDKERETMEVNVQIKESLAPKQVKVKAMYEERQLEGQMNIDDMLTDAKKEVAAIINKNSEDE